jgi:thiosulfate dehydrogenase
VCDDGDSCTTDTCNAASGDCEYDAVVCPAGEQCNAATGECEAGPGDPPEFTNADATRGGALYDEYWEVAGVAAAEPTEDHPLWATRPDMTSNPRSGAETWRCKECHGWDYKGVNGAYGGGDHRTGIAGVFGTSLSPQATFDTIKDGHGYGAAGLTDADIWDLARFVLDGQVDTDNLIDGNGAFVGTEGDGQPTYDNTCMACHGADGLGRPPGSDVDYEDSVGEIANDNPWKFQHIVRFGDPGTTMPPQHGMLTVSELADLGAYAQTLPTGPTQDVGDPVAGANFYTANNCAFCHCADAAGGCLPGTPPLVDEESGDLFDVLSGADSHTGGTVPGATQQDADNLAAWLATL